VTTLHAVINSKPPSPRSINPAVRVELEKSSQGDGEGSQPAVQDATEMKPTWHG